MSINRVIISGNLARDVNIYANTQGTNIATFCVASSNPKSDATFVDCEAFACTAVNIHKYFRKGKPILIEGKLVQRKWVDKNTGERRNKMVVAVERFDFAPEFGNADNPADDFSVEQSEFENSDLEY